MEERYSRCQGYSMENHSLWMELDNNRCSVLGKSNLNRVLDNHKLRRVLGMRSSRNWVMGIGMVFDMTLMGLDSWGLDSHNLVSRSLATDRYNQNPELGNHRVKYTMEGWYRLLLETCSHFQACSTAMYRCLLECSKKARNRSELGNSALSKA